MYKTGHSGDYSHINPADILDVKALKRLHGSLPLKNYEIDWRYKEGIVNLEIRNQQGCNSCFAFAATEIYWSARALHGYQREPYVSVQQILDCVPKNDYGQSRTTEYKYSCKKGALSYDVLSFLRDHKPALETVYEYFGRDNGCKIKYVPISENERIIQKLFTLPTVDLNRYNQKKYQSRDSAPYETELADEEQIAHALYHYGPLSVAIDSTFLKDLDQQDMPSIITAADCSREVEPKIQRELHKIKMEKLRNPNTPTRLVDFKHDIFNMHEVTLVGLQRDPRTGKRYWILKVS